MWKGAIIQCSYQYVNPQKTTIKHTHIELLVFIHIKSVATTNIEIVESLLFRFVMIVCLSIYCHLWNDWSSPFHRYYHNNCIYAKMLLKLVILSEFEFLTTENWVNRVWNLLLLINRYLFSCHGFDCSRIASN